MTWTGQLKEDALVLLQAEFGQEFVEDTKVKTIAVLLEYMIKAYRRAQGDNQAWARECEYLRKQIGELNKTKQIYDELIQKEKEKSYIECDSCSKKFPASELSWTQCPFAMEMSIGDEKDRIPYQWMCSDCYSNAVGDI